VLDWEFFFSMWFCVLTIRAFSLAIFFLSCLVYFSHPLQRSPEDLQQLLAWYKIRDTMFGQNYVKQSKKKPLGLSAVCEHPEAVWLTKLFAGRNINNYEDVVEVFRSCESDLRALYFAGLISGSFDDIRRAADLGDAYAQAMMATAEQMEGQECFRWAEKSVAQGERDGFYWLGFCHEDGHGCEKNVERAKENFLIAAELGHVHAMLCFGKLLDKSDPQRFVWLGKARVDGMMPSLFLDEMAEQIRNFSSGMGLANVVFAIGRALKGHIDNEKREIFRNNYKFDRRIGFANQALYCLISRCPRVEERVEIFISTPLIKKYSPFI
jgi:hypothetical protein